MCNQSEKCRLMGVLLMGCLLGGICISSSSTLNLFQLHLKTSMPIPHYTQIFVPIFINGNGNFTSANGVSGGNGTASNPYLIMNLIINASSATGIEIENTNAFVVIQNCSITNGSSNFIGISLSNVQNAVIMNNTVNSNNYGIYLYHIKQ